MYTVQRAIRYTSVVDILLIYNGMGHEKWQGIAGYQRCVWSAHTKHIKYRKLIIKVLVRFNSVDAYIVHHIEPDEAIVASYIRIHGEEKCDFYTAI